LWALGSKTYNYQTDFRFYDPQRAQWGDIDLLGQFASAYDFVGGNPLSFIDPTGLLGVFVGETIVRGAGAGLAKGLARTAANIGANLLVKQITPAGSTRVDKPILPSQIKPSKPQATPQPQLSASKPRSTFQLDMKALSGNMEYWQNYGGGGILHTLASPVTNIIASHYEARLHDGMYGRSYWRGVGIRAKGTSKAWTVLGAVQSGAALFGGAAVKGGTGTLFHYTSETGYKAIMETGELLPSIGVKNARYGAGQYLTDIAPGQFTMGQTSRRLFGVPWNRNRLTYFIELDVTGLNTIKNAPFNYVIPGTGNLPLGGRIVNGGASIFK
jgi:HYD1 signature containing ADP-ribosyltransferase